MNHFILWSTAWLLLLGTVDFRSYSSFKDSRDGHEYKFTAIGDKKIMVENLAFEAENAFCYQNEDNFCGHYGKLYDFQTAVGEEPTFNIQGICPKGWHIPTADEWLYILRGLNGKVTAKRHNFISFLVPHNLLRMRFSGFKSHHENRFYRLGQKGFYMTSSQENGYWTVVEVRRQGMADMMAMHSKISPKRAISCRCIKDE